MRVNAVYCDPIQLGTGGDVRVVAAIEKTNPLNVFNNYVVNIFWRTGGSGWQFLETKKGTAMAEGVTTIDLGSYNVRRIEPPPQPYLNNSYINFLLCKIVEGHGNRKFKK